MRLTRKTDQVVEPKAPALGLNRRQFLKSAGLATGGIAAASMLGTGMMRKAEAKDIPTMHRLKLSVPFALTAQWVVVSMLKYKTVCGQAKNPHLTIHSTKAVTVLKVLLCVSTAMAKNA